MDIGRLSTGHQARFWTVSKGSLESLSRFLKLQVNESGITHKQSVTRTLYFLVLFFLLRASYLPASHAIGVTFNLIGYAISFTCTAFAFKLKFNNITWTWSLFPHSGGRGKSWLKTIAWGHRNVHECLEFLEKISFQPLTIVIRDYLRNLQRYMLVAIPLTESFRSNSASQASLMGQKGVCCGWGHKSIAIIFFVRNLWSQEPKTWRLMQ